MDQPIPIRPLGALAEPDPRRWLLAAAWAALLALPPALMYARAIGDGLLSLVAALFLLDRALRRDARWLAAPWTAAGLALWAWTLACTAAMAGVPALLQAAAALRFYVFVAALEFWALADPAARRWLYRAVAAAALWIAAESWHQYVLGTNLAGYPRWPDGALTGPFLRPRAGALYLLLFFPAVLPPVLWLTRAGEARSRLLALALLGIAAATMVLIGQRMPAALMVLGLCAAGLLFRRVRLPLALALGACALLLAATPVLSPPTFEKMVHNFSYRLAHFWTSPYGLLFERAVAMIRAHPWTGLGWDGFRDHCAEAAYLGGVPWLPVPDPADPAGCTLHPHNYWTQVGTSAGLPGMALFALLAGLWLWRIAGNGAWRGNDQRAALLVAAFVMLWPVASATSLFTVPNAGWTFLFIGWGLAEARAGERGVAATGGPAASPAVTSLLWPNLATVRPPAPAPATASGAPPAATGRAAGQPG